MIPLLRRKFRLTLPCTRSSLLYDTGVFSTKLKQVNRKPPGDRLSHSPLLVAVNSAFLSSPYAVRELGGTLTFLFYDQHQWKCRSLSLLPHGEEGQWEKSPVWELQAPHSLGPASPPAVVGEVVLCSMWCQRGPWGSCPHWRRSWECGRCCLLAPPSSVLGTAWHWVGLRKGRSRTSTCEPLMPHICRWPTGHSWSKPRLGVGGDFTCRDYLEMCFCREVPKYSLI